MGERTHRTLGDQKSEQENVVPKFFGLLYFTGKSANNTERLCEIHFKRRYEKVDTLCMDEYLHSAPGNKTPDNELSGSVINSYYLRCITHSKHSKGTYGLSGECCFAVLS